MKPIEWVRGEFAQYVQEEPLGSNSGPRVDFYTGGRAEPWCAHFIATAFRECGYPLPGDVKPSPKQHNPIAAVSEMERLCKEAKIWFPADDPKKHPLVPGDIMFLKMRQRSDRGPGRHVAIVDFVSGAYVQTFDGNWEHKIATVRRYLGNDQISGYARPVFT